MVRISICPFEPSIKRVQVSHVIIECRVIKGGGVRPFTLSVVLGP